MAADELKAAHVQHIDVQAGFDVDEIYITILRSPHKFQTCFQSHQLLTEMRNIQRTVLGKYFTAESQPQHYLSPLHSRLLKLLEFWWIYFSNTTGIQTGLPSS